METCNPTSDSLKDIKNCKMYESQRLEDPPTSAVVNIGNFDYNPHHLYSKFELMITNNHLNSNCQLEERVIVLEDFLNGDSERKTEGISGKIVPKIVGGNNESNAQNTEIADNKKSEKCGTPSPESNDLMYNDEDSYTPICSIAESRSILLDFPISPKSSHNPSPIGNPMTIDDEVLEESVVKQKNEPSLVRSIRYGSQKRSPSDYLFFEKPSKTSTYDKFFARSPIYPVDKKNLIRSPGYETPTYRLSDFVVIKKRGEVVGYMSPIRSIGSNSPSKARASPRSIGCGSPSYKCPDFRLNDCFWTDRRIVYHPIIYDPMVETARKENSGIVAEVELLDNDAVRIVIHSDTREDTRSGQLKIEDAKEEGNHEDLSKFSVKSQTLREKVENPGKNDLGRLEVSVSSSRQIESVSDQNKENIEDDSKAKAAKRKYEDIVSDEDAGKTESISGKKRRNHDWSHIEMIRRDTYRCTVCEKTFNKIQCKWYHSVCRSKENLLKCEICNRSFNKRSHFEYHERAHKGEKPFVCQVCHKGFPTKGKLNRHLVIHEKRTGLECAECGKKFNSKDYLKIHVMTHLKISHECKICQKTFPTEFQLRRHERSHSSARPFKCDVCSKDFKDNFGLVKHKRSHGTKRPFRCKKCRQAFLTKSELSRHTSIHTDSKPYVCQICDKSFRRKDNMLRHVRYHHMENTPSTEEAAIIAAKKFEDGMKKNQKESKAKSKKKTSGTKDSSQIVQKNGMVRESVIKSPVRLKSFVDDSTKKLTDPIPHATAVEINRRIEEKIRSQGQSLSPGLHRSIIFDSRTGNGFDSKTKVGTRSKYKRNNDISSKEPNE